MASHIANHILKFVCQVRFLIRDRLIIISTARNMASGSSGGDIIAPVVTRDEVQRLVDLGLGRGVDATKHHLWNDKSSFQVQYASESLDNIIGTDEGGLRHYYEREVSSVDSRQTQITLSVEDPNTSVHVGMDTLYSQNLNKTKRSVGEQVMTRTISFRSKFDDLPLHGQNISGKVLERRVKPVAAKSQSPLTSTNEEISKEGEGETEAVKSFEEELSDWLIDRIRGRGEAIDSPHSEDTTSNHKDTALKFHSSTAKLAKYLNSARQCQENSDCFQAVISDCFMFVKQTGVTHYVHSIQLGAMKFRVLNSTEYNKKISVKGNLGAEGIAKSSIEQTMSSRNKKSSLNVKEIGKIVDGRVRKGTTDEAVIGFQLMPIHKLVRSYHVNEALRRALRDYIAEKVIKRSKYILGA